VYVSRQKLGTKIGNKRFYSQSDVQKLLKVSKKSPATKKAKTPAKKVISRKKSATAAVESPSAAKPKADGSKASSHALRPNAPSFWTRLFGGRKQKQKVSLLDAKTTR
jgi:hypothetical protein